MVDNWDDDDDEQQGDIASQLPKPARDHLRKVERQNSKLLERLAELETAQRATTVTSVLSAEGLSPELSRYALTDLGENVTAESVKAWATEKADLFGRPSAPPADTVAPPATPAPDLTGLAQMQAAETAGATIETDGDSAVLAKIKSFGDVADPEQGKKQLAAYLASVGLMSQN